MFSNIPQISFVLSRRVEGMEHFSEQLYSWKNCLSRNKIVLEATDTLTVNSDANNSVDVALTILEMTQYGTNQGYSGCH